MHRAHTHPIRFALLSLLFALLAAPAAAQVTAVSVKKNWEYVQTGPSTVVANPTVNAFGFGADVDGINIGGITPPTVSGPINVGALGALHNNGVLVYRPGDSGWRYGLNADDFGTSSIADLDAKFGGGTYTFNVMGATVALNLTGYLFPNPPRMTLTGGAWSNGRYVIDPSQALTITTNAFTGYGTHVEDVICMAIIGGAFKLPFEEIGPYGCAWANVDQSSSSNPSNTASFSLPAGTLQNGQEYTVFTGFATVADKKTHPMLPGATLAAHYEVSTFVTVKAESSVFPMTVTGTTGPPTANLNATFSLRPQDQGTPQNVYKFAVAPVTMTLPLLKSSADDEPLVLGYAKTSAGDRYGRPKADTSIACVLAQLNGAGKLQQVSASGLQAFVTGVLGSASQSVAIVDGIATATIGGATFYLSYGGSPQSMLQQGSNRPVATIPGQVECRPSPPQTGWWWNKTEGGRGYSIETQGNQIFYAAYLYDDAGRAQWFVANGPTSIDGSYFTGNLLKVTGGQTLGGAYKAPAAPQAAGALTLAFTEPGKGTMVGPGGAVPIERFGFSGLGPNSPKRTNQPEAGWWWNPQEGGRGFFLEWQGDSADIATYMYDDAGNPVWYLSLFPAPDVRNYSGNWWLYANGQSLTGAFKPAVQVNANVAPVTIQFTSATTATMTLPNGRTTALQRFRF
jgi:hypothetical protein